MLKNGLIAMLVAFSLFGCANYTRPKSLAVANVNFYTPPPYNEKNFSVQDSNRFVGNIDAYLWCALEIPLSDDQRILDLGPELVDEAKLFVQSLDEWSLYDQTGKNVANSKKKVQGTRCALKIPPQQSTILLRVKNSDTTALVFRIFSLGDYFLQTTKFNLVHGMSAAMFLMSLCMQLLIWICRRPKHSLSIFAVTMLFFIYQLCMKGIGPALLWNKCMEAGLFSGFFLHLTYTVATFGFVIILILALQCIKLESRFAIRKQITSMFIGCAFLFAILFSFSPNFDFVYRLAICVLIAGLVFEIIVIIFGTRKRKSDFSLLLPWCVFFVFLVFRQSFHLIRKSKDYFFLSALMDNDYYFSYDIAFLLVNIGYVFLIVRKNAPHKRTASQLETPQTGNTLAMNVLADGALVENTGNAPSEDVLEGDELVRGATTENALAGNELVGGAQTRNVVAENALVENALAGNKRNAGVAAGNAWDGNELVGDAQTGNALVGGESTETSKMQEISFQNAEKDEEKSLPLLNEEKGGESKIRVAKKSLPSMETILMAYGLTQREIEVAKLLCSKRNDTKYISSNLNISVNTTATHIKRIYEKCAVHSKFQLYCLINSNLTQTGETHETDKIT